MYDIHFHTQGKSFSSLDRLDSIAAFARARTDADKFLLMGVFDKGDGHSRLLWCEIWDHTPSVYLCIYNNYLCIYNN
ncbi:hypothetical protein HanRHA438_Chr09g0405851 [Helianthus annuus]|nr:hypothetical protein HanRHA438_Chr09g0405851 [Helianthus annuus]